MHKSVFCTVKKLFFSTANYAFVTTCSVLRHHISSRHLLLFFSGWKTQRNKLQVFDKIIKERRYFAMKRDVVGTHPASAGVDELHQFLLSSLRDSNSRTVPVLHAHGHLLWSAREKVSIHAVCIETGDFWFQWKQTDKINSTERHNPLHRVGRKR